MTRKNFNSQSANRLSNYHIELNYPKDADNRTKLLLSANFKGTLAEWIAHETGVLPDLQPLTNGLGVSIHATAGFMKKIEAQFPHEIAHITKVPARGKQLGLTDSAKKRSDQFKNQRGMKYDSYDLPDQDKEFKPSDSYKDATLPSWIKKKP